MQSLDEFVEFGFLTSLQASKVLEPAASHLGLRFEAASDQFLGSNVVVLYLAQYYDAFRAGNNGSPEFCFY